MSEPMTDARLEQLETLMYAISPPYQTWLKEACGEIRRLREVERNLLGITENAKLRKAIQRWKEEEESWKDTEAKLREVVEAAKSFVLDETPCSLDRAQRDFDALESALRELDEADKCPE